MKKMLVLIFMGVICIALLAACNTPSNTSAPTDIPDAPPAEPPAEDTNEALPATENPEMPIINLAGPDLGTQMRWHDGSLLIFVPDGDFIMGATYENPQDQPEHPEHVVDQSGFWIYRSEVSNGMYANCVADGSCTEPATNITTDYLNAEKRNHPVVGVDWYQAQAYCSWADGHLPTESQWEKTARGPDGNLYPWGDAKPDCNLLNFDNCVNEKLSSGSYLSITSPIRKYFDGASYYEALDMAGNVFEWTQDWYKSDYYQESPTADPPGPPDGEYKSVRSSAFRSTSSLVPSVLRDSFAPNEYRDDLGFRCVVEKPPYYAPVCVYTPPQETEDCPPPTLDVTDSSCKKGTGMVEFDLSEGAILTSTGCTETTPNHYICYGASGGFINMTFCSDCESVEDVCEIRSCGIGYVPDLETCECVWGGCGEEPIAGFEIESGGSLLFSLASPLGRVVGGIGGAGGCPPAFQWDENPWQQAGETAKQQTENDTANKEPREDPCPLGRYWDQQAQICVPPVMEYALIPFHLDFYFTRDLMETAPEEYLQYPPGTIYDEEHGCYASDGTMTPVSPAATTCVTNTLQFGVCDTPPAQRSCIEHENQNDCEAANC
ncbi:MAG: SUMF1/EgtB/PvdO family nonheme iron enzyme, partial [Anaerolineales bacterium]|nr:SUMF1/EgtB/PvdO family nonheme iron enzyme [Anaerolineales bacterium]